MSEVDDGAMCPRCGVLVIEAELHRRWHVELDEAIRRAARTATARPTTKRR